MAEASPPSINDCLAQLRQCLDPAAAAAITQLNAAINARVDRLTQAVEGPSPWLEVGRALVRQVQTTRPRSQPGGPLPRGHDVVPWAAAVESVLAIVLLRAAVGEP